VNCIEYQSNHQAEQSSETRTDRRELDQTLIAAAQAGSDSAYEQLYNLYAKSIYRIAYSITKNREDAEDALQDAFLRAYLGLAEFRRESQFYSWVVRIAINSSLMLLRKRRTRRELPMGADSTEDAFIPADFKDSRPNPEQFYRARQAQTFLTRSIQRLPGQLRAVVELRLLRDRSTGETGRILGVSDAAIKSRLFRARNRLATMHTVRVLAQDHGGERRAPEALFS
jgi:RNA polymerase sigma-70 factor (ECF subfamily)